MNEMEKRVARAIWEAQNENPISSFECSAENYTESKTFKQARAVIEAMREPTEEMVEAGKCLECGCQAGIWRDMIDEARK